MILRTLTAALVLCGGSAAANAQQTVAGAHEFFRIMAAQGMRASIDRGYGLNRAYKSGSRRKCQSYNEVTLFGTKRKRDCFNDTYSEPYTHAAFPLAVESDGRCRTTLRPGDPGYARKGGYGTETYTITGPDLTPVVINWGRVAKVTQRGRLVDVTGILPKIVLEMASDDLAARTAFAAEFLRSKCDPAAQTGF